VLYCTVRHCSVVYCIVLQCIVSYSSILHCNIPNTVLTETFCSSVIHQAIVSDKEKEKEKEKGIQMDSQSIDCVMVGVMSMALLLSFLCQYYLSLQFIITDCFCFPSLSLLLQCHYYSNHRIHCYHYSNPNKHLYYYPLRSATITGLHCCQSPSCITPLLCTP
jgi:hypothetical protein